MKTILALCIVGSFFLFSIGSLVMMIYLAYIWYWNHRYIIEDEMTFRSRVIAEYRAHQMFEQCLVDIRKRHVNDIQEAAVVA
jgi:hypothetical protein